MEFVSFHRAGLTELRRLLRSMPDPDRLSLWSELKLLNEFGEQFIALFAITDHLVELVVDHGDPPVAVILERRDNSSLHVLAAYQRQGDTRSLAVQRAYDRSNDHG